MGIYWKKEGDLDFCSKIMNYKFHIGWVFGVLATLILIMVNLLIRQL